jgi:hypothetical protein
MNKMYSLNEIKAEVVRLASRIGTPDNLLPTYGHSEDGARPHIEVDSRGYHYVVVERGEEISRITTHELDELLYRIFEGVTFGLACEYELRHRVRNKDFRRLLFKYQVELLTRLSPKWGEIESQDQARILQRHPYDDSLTQY